LFEGGGGEDTAKEIAMLYRLKKHHRANLWGDGIIVGDTIAECEKLAALLADKSLGPVGVDTEGTNLNLKKESPIGKGRIVSVQFAWRDGRKAFVPNWGEFEGNIRVFKSFLKDSTPRKVLHNAKFDMHMFENHRVPMNGLLGDTQVMDYIKDTGEMFHGLKECIRRYFGKDTREYSDVFRQPKPLKKGGFSKTQTYVEDLQDVVKTSAGIRKLVDYAVEDPVYAVQLYDYLAAELKKMPWRPAKGLSYFDYYETFELPYTGVLQRMERKGCPLDGEYLKQMMLDVSAELKKAEVGFYAACMKAGVDPVLLTGFNMGSADQVGKLLEHELGAVIVARTPTGKVQVSDDVLEKVKGPAKGPIKALLKWRNLRKLLTTYAEPLSRCAERYNGKVHSNFKQASVATMRLSSSAPNLQNIPTKAKDAFGIRKAFVASEGYVIADIDLSQIEMRLAAHFTGDELIIKAIRDGWDLHALTATKAEAAVRAWVGVRDVTPELLQEVKEKFPDERQRSKTLNFGVLYGMGAQGYAALTGASEHESQAAINGFFMLYPGLKRGIYRIQAGCEQTGSVRSLLGRWINIPDIRSNVKWMRSAALRQAFNYVIQGSASDLLKMSMILIDRDERLKEMGVRMILQIHDELLFEVKEGDEAEAKEIIEAYVSRPYEFFGFKKLVVDTPAEMGFGSNWMEAK
jgi:DNA polymerase I